MDNWKQTFAMRAENNLSAQNNLQKRSWVMSINCFWGNPLQQCGNMLPHQKTTIYIILRGKQKWLWGLQCERKVV